MNQSLEKVLAGFIDYAGLFPPAGLSMNDAVAEYSGRSKTEERWALSRFVVPASRLEEFAASRATIADPRGLPWSLSVLLAPSDVATSRRQVDAFEAAHHELAGLGSVEVAVSEPVHIATVTEAFPEVPRYFEIDARDDPWPLLAAIAEHGGAAKIRTGGLVAEAFPSVAELARFIRSVWQAGIAFKATAGLHHPVRGTYPLTYERDADRGTMHGYLNLVVAAALVDQLDTNELEEVLSSADELRLCGDDLCWRSYRLDSQQIADTRTRLFHSIGSCSIIEPVDELHEFQNASSGLRSA